MVSKRKRKIVKRAKKTDKPCTDCKCLCPNCKERVLELVRVIAGELVAAAVTTGATGNKWVAISPAKKKRGRA